MKSEWAKVVKSQSLFWPRISKARRSDAGQVGIWTVAHSGQLFFLSNDDSCTILSHGNQMECSKQAFTVLKGMESPFSGWRWREERLIQRRLSLKLVHFMPDVVRYLWCELLTTFLGAVAAPLLISDSDFGSEQIVPTSPVSALYSCIIHTYVFLHEKYSKLSSITRVQIASRFLHWNTRDIARSRFASKTPARSVTCIQTEKARREWCCVSTIFRWRKPVVNW